MQTQERKKLGNRLGERIEKDQEITQKETRTETTQKTLKWKMLPQGLYVVFWEGGGEVPPELSGFFTSAHLIKRAITNYETRKDVTCLVQ